MSESLYSPLWYRVAGLRPALRPHLRVIRHVYRGEEWCVLHDPASGRHWRFSMAAQRVIARLDGTATVEQVWADLGAGTGEMPTQGEVLRLLAQLHAAEALSTDVPADAAELLRRQRARRSQDRLARFGNPVAVRTKLFDPDALLTWLLPWVRPFCGTAGRGVWLLVVALACLVAAARSAELGRSISDVLLAPDELALALLVYPLVKAIHELAHGIAIKLRGGEVHEVGLMWLVFVPLPYVDASAAAAFPEKRARMRISAAGVVAEILVAALALLLWASVEPGMVRATAWNVVLVAGFSTLFVNANPLLRYDGYYWFADLVEIPNLGTRASRYLTHLLRTRILGLADEREMHETPAERRWLLGYGIAALAYRVLVVVMIVTIVASWSELLAILLAAILLVLQVLRPLFRGLRALRADPRVRNAPWRVIARSLAAVLVLGAVFLLPVPLSTSTQGIVWLPEHGELRAGTDGELRAWLAEPGTLVEAGAPIAVLDDPLAELRLARAQAQLGAAQARHLAARASNPVEAAAARTALERARIEHDAALERAQARTLVSTAAGRLVVPHAEDAIGRFYRQGNIVAYVVPRTGGTVLAVLGQDDIALVKERVRDVQVRMAEAPGSRLDARIVRLAPGGGFELPSAALGRPAGGSVAVAPDDPDGRRSLVRIFRVELALERPSPYLGARAWVRFDHGAEVLAMRIWRAGQRLFLRHFHV